MSLNDFEIMKRLGIYFIDLLILNFIGEGAYSSVYHVRRINDNSLYALKKVRM